MCLRGQELDFKCIGVFPQLFDAHRRAGRKGADSDITGTMDFIGDNDAKADEIRKTGFTANIVRPVRLNWKTLVRGVTELTDIPIQYPIEDMPPLEGPMSVTASMDAGKAEYADGAQEKGDQNAHQHEHHVNIS